SSVELSADLSAQTEHNPLAADRYEIDGPGDAGLETHRRPGGDVEPLTVGRVPIELQRRIGFGEVEGRADLHRTIATVDHAERGARQPPVELDRAVGSDDLSWDHRAHRIG